MNSFKSFVKNFGADKADDLRSREKSESLDDAFSSTGFLCPMCLKSFSSPELLQHHFQLEHDDEANETNNGSSTDFEGLKNEMTEIHSTLKEERSTAQELKAQLEKLMNTAASPAVNGNNDAVSEIKKAYENQIASLDREKSSLSEEVLRLKERILESEVKLKDNEKISEKASELAMENVGLKAAVDEVSAQKLALEDERRALLRELEQREAQIEKCKLETSMNKNNEIEELKRDRLSDADQISYLTTENRDLKNKMRETEAILLKTQSDLSLKDTEMAGIRKNLEKWTSENETSVQVEKNKVTDLTDQLKSLQKLYNELSHTNDDLRSQFNEEKLAKEEMFCLNEDRGKKIEELEIDLVNFKSELERMESERGHLMAQIETGEGASTALQQLQRENELLMTKVEEEKSRSKRTTEKHECDISKLRSEISESKKVETELTNRLKKMEKVVSEAEARAENFSNEKSRLSEELQAKSAVLKETEMALQSCESQVASNLNLFLQTEKSNKVAEERIEELKKEKENLAESLKEKTEIIKKNETQIKRLQLENSDTLRELDEVKISQSTQHITEIENLTAKYNNAKLELDAKSEKLSNLEVEMESFKDSTEKYRESTESSLAELKTKLADSQTLNKDNVELLRNYEENVKELGSENVKLTREVEAAIRDKSDCEERICQLQKYWETQEKLHREQMKDLEVTKELLLTTKADMREKLENAMADVEKVKVEKEHSIRKVNEQLTKAEMLVKELKTRNHEVQENLKREINGLRESESTISSKLESEIKSRSDLQESNESLTKRLNEAESKLDEALSSQLELEAQVGASNDERRVLLERCLSAESELDRSRSNVVQLRRKLDDSQAALHELGRENQSLQLELNKLTGRKWADDSDVVECVGCKNPFSLTVRKHHCRNCGQIFCADCSTKTATMPNYKKPQRVCDGCFEELAAK